MNFKPLKPLKPGKTHCFPYHVRMTLPYSLIQQWGHTRFKWFILIKSILNEKKVFFIWEFKICSCKILSFKKKRMKNPPKKIISVIEESLHGNSMFINRNDDKY